jgi:hypothetical protein
MKVFKSDLPMLPIQKVPDLSHGSSKRESKTLRKKIDEKAESLKEQILKKSDHLDCRPYISDLRLNY